MTDPRDTWHWKQLSVAVRERDGMCVVCGSTENLQADHIQPVSEYPELAFDPDNIVTMCGKHNRQKSNRTTGQLYDWVNPVWLAWESNRKEVAA